MAQKTTLPIVCSLIVILAFSCIFVNLAIANPVPAKLMGEIAPDDKTTPPTIQFLSPDTTKVQNTSVVVSFTVDVGRSETATFMYLQEVSYDGDWRQSPVILYRFNEIGEKKNNNLSTFSATLNLTDVLEGNRTITVHATAWGKYEKTIPDANATYDYTLEYYTFKIANSALTQFTVDKPNNEASTAPSPTPEQTPSVEPTQAPQETVSPQPTQTNPPNSSPALPEAGTNATPQDNSLLLVVVGSVIIVAIALGALILLKTRRQDAPHNL